MLRLRNGRAACDAEPSSASNLECNVREETEGWGGRTTGLSSATTTVNCQHSSGKWWEPLDSLLPVVLPSPAPWLAREDALVQEHQHLGKAGLWRSHEGNISALWSRKCGSKADRLAGVLVLSPGTPLGPHCSWDSLGEFPEGAWFQK